jgi:hypothetical protein
MSAWRVADGEAELYRKGLAATEELNDETFRTERSSLTFRIGLTRQAPGGWSRSTQWRFQVAGPLPVSRRDDSLSRNALSSGSRSPARHAEVVECRYPSSRMGCWEEDRFGQTVECVAF